VSKNPFRASGVFTAILIITFSVSPAFARSKNRSRSYLGTNQVEQLDAALKSNDVDSAQAIAVAIYQQATNAPALQSTDPTLIIDPVVVAQTMEFNRTRSACDIAACFYRHADLDDARRWATTATTGGTLGEQYVRRATVLLGNIATAMDNDAVAVTNFLSVITLPGLYHEQPAAYAGLLEALMLQKQDDQVTQWVQNGQTQFAGSGDLELDFLKQASAALKRRNQPLWQGLDQQIAGLSSSGPGNKLNALRQLASNARKFGRWAEAETNYAAICAMPLNSAEETVNSYLFLAESQTKQGEDITTTLSGLAVQCAGFANPEDCEYGTYRVAKFYDEQGSNDLAAAGYGALVSSLSTSTWAAASLHQLGALKERQGDMHGALQLYLQYPQSFPQNDRLVMQSYASALNVADSLGDTNTASLVLGAITNRAGLIQDYNVYLNLAFHYKKSGHPDIASELLTNGLSLAQQTLQITTDPHSRYTIHFRVLRRIADFDQWQQTLNYFQTYAADFSATDNAPDDFKYQCYWYKAYALFETTNRQAALDTFQWLVDQETGRPQLQARTAETLAVLYSSVGANASSAQFFEAVTREFPTHQWAHAARIALAVGKFNAGDVAGARKLADEITNTLSENSKMVWIQDTYWSAIYLRGRCLQAQGNVSGGDSLKQLALSKVPELSIPNRLRQP